MMALSLALVVGAGAFAFNKGATPDRDKCGAVSSTCEKDRKCDGKCPKDKCPKDKCPEDKCPEGTCPEGKCGDHCKRPAAI